MKIRDFACGVYTLLCAVLQWASDSGIATPFVNLCSNIWGALGQFCCELYNSSMGSYISSMGGCICKPFKDMFMKGFNFVKSLCGLCVATCYPMLVAAAPNMLVGIAILVLILDMCVSSSANMEIYTMKSAGTWIQWIDKFVGANCQCIELAKNLDVVALEKCIPTKNEQGLKGIVSQQFCETLNYYVLNAKLHKTHDTLVFNTFCRVLSLFNGQKTALSTWQTWTRWLFCNFGCIYGLYNNRQDFWTYVYGVLFCITVFNLWCFYMRHQEYGWRVGLFEYCTVEAWLQMFLFFMGEYIIKSIFPQWSGAQDNTTDNENPSTPQGTRVTWGATSSAYPAHTPSQRQTPSIWPLQSIQSRIAATQHGAHQVSPRAVQPQGLSAAHPYTPQYSQNPLHPAADLYPPAPLYHAASRYPLADLYPSATLHSSTRSTSDTARGTSAKSPTTRRRTTHGLY